MELKLNIYKTRLCREIERTATANDFELSTGVCEDVLNIINIDLLEGGIQSLSDESMLTIIIGIIKNGFPFFMELVQEIFDISEQEAKCLKLTDIAKVVFEIVKYSKNQLTFALGGKGKN